MAVPFTPCVKRICQPTLEIRVIIDPSPPLQPPAAQQPPKHTIYALVRLDIIPAQQMVQAAHAVAEAARRYYRAEHGTASVIVLSVPDKAALHAAQARLAGKGVATALFHEPSFGIGDSALATEPLCQRRRRHLSTWPLWRPTEAWQLAAAHQGQLQAA